MKNAITISALVFMILFVNNHLLAQKKTSFNAYSAVATRYQSPQGSIVLKVYSIGKNVTEARKKAQRDAVHAIIFQGVSGTRYPKPMINDIEDFQNDKKYWKDFFGVQDLTIGKPVKKANPAYRNYVKVVANYTVDPKDKRDIGGKQSVGILVEVAYDNLRAKLEKDGKVQKFGF